MREMVNTKWRMRKMRAVRNTKRGILPGALGL
jgi:hypothetical protein